MIEVKGITSKVTTGRAEQDNKRILLRLKW